MAINLIAPINPLGYGQVGLNVLLGLEALGLEPALFPIGPTEFPPEHGAVVTAAALRASWYDNTAPSVRIWHQDRLAEHVGQGDRYGYPFFELDPLDGASVHHINRNDGLLVASAWAKGVAERSGVEVPIAVVPLGVDRTIFHEGLVGPRPDADHTIFFNVGKWEVRKGHDFLIAAFNKAFERTDKVQLRLLCDNPFLGPGNEDWRRRADGSKLGASGQIVCVGRMGSQHEVARFMAGCDVGVFPSRAEGWNLDLLECLSVGRQAIATNYSAHTEFLTPIEGAGGDRSRKGAGGDRSSNARQIDVEGLETASDGVWFFGQGEWAKLGSREEEQLIAHLRAIHFQKQAGNLPPLNAAGIATAERFSWRATVATLARAVGLQTTEA